MPPRHNRTSRQVILVNSLLQSEELLPHQVHLKGRLAGWAVHNHFGKIELASPTDLFYTPRIWDSVLFSAQTHPLALADLLAEEDSGSEDAVEVDSWFPKAVYPINQRYRWGPKEPPPPPTPAAAKAPPVVHKAKSAKPPAPVIPKTPTPVPQKAAAPVPPKVPAPVPKKPPPPTAAQCQAWFGKNSSVTAASSSTSVYQPHTHASSHTPAPLCPQPKGDPLPKPPAPPPSAPDCRLALDLHNTLDNGRNDGEIPRSSVTACWQFLRAGFLLWICSYIGKNGADSFQRRQRAEEI